MNFDAEWRQSTTIRHAQRAELQPMIEAHYLGKWPAVVPCKLIMVSQELGNVGMVVFGYPPRETFKRYGGLVWELARLWIDDRVPRNGESWMIAKSIGHIKREHADVIGLVSYADPSANHSGQIYRAANWREDGCTDEGRKTPRFDYLSNGIRYSRRSHIPVGQSWSRIPRISKYRFYYQIIGRIELSRVEEQSGRPGGAL